MRLILWNGFATHLQLHAPAPPMPSGKGVVPVIKRTMWLMESASAKLNTNWVSPTCSMSVWTCKGEQLWWVFAAVVEKDVSCRNLKFLGWYHLGGGTLANTPSPPQNIVLFYLFILFGLLNRSNFSDRPTCCIQRCSGVFPFFQAESENCNSPNVQRRSHQTFW